MIVSEVVSDGGGAFVLGSTEIGFRIDPILALLAMLALSSPLQRYVQSRVNDGEYRREGSSNHIST